MRGLLVYGEAKKETKMVVIKGKSNELYSRLYTKQYETVLRQRPVFVGDGQTLPPPSYLTVHISDCTLSAPVAHVLVHC